MIMFTVQWPTSPIWILQLIKYKMINLILIVKNFVFCELSRLSNVRVFDIDIQEWNFLKPTKNDLLSVAAFSRFLLSTAQDSREKALCVARNVLLPYSFIH